MNHTLTSKTPDLEEDDMAKQFFLKRGEKVLGPMDTTDFRQRASNGEIVVSDEFSESRTGPWRRVDATATLRKLVVQATLLDNLRLAKNCTVCLHCWRKCPDKPKQSLLQFIQVKCPRCSRKSTYPFSRWAVVFFWFSVVSFVPLAVFGTLFLEQSWLTWLPCSGLIIALYGLRRDREILRSLKNPSGPAPHERPVIDKLVLGVVLLLNGLGAVIVEGAEQKQERILELNNRGIALLGRKKFDLAKDDFTSALQRDPNLARVYLNRGLAYRALGQHDEAIADFSTAIRQLPSAGLTPGERLVTRLLEGLFETKPSETRAEVLQRGILREVVLAEELAEAYHQRGLAHHAKGENDKALLDFNEAIRRHPLAVYLLNRGTTYLDMGDHEKAKADIRVAKKTGLGSGLQFLPRVLHLLDD